MEGRKSEKIVRRAVSLILTFSISLACIAGSSSYLFNNEAGNPAANIASDDHSYGGSSLTLKGPDEIKKASNSTGLAKISDSLSIAFSEMPDSVSDDNDAAKAADTFREDIKSLKAEAQNAVEGSKENASAEDIESYKEKISQGFSRIDPILSDISAYNYEESLDEISKIINPEIPDVPLAADGELPFSTSEPGAISSEEYVPEASSVAAGNAADGEADGGEADTAGNVGNTGGEGYTDSDLSETDDTIINDATKASFSDLNSVLDIYHYIRNNYKSEFYYGSRKGAYGAFSEKSGNDYDLNSLFIGILDSVGKLYFGQLDLYDRVIAGQYGVTSDRSLSIGIVGFNAIPSYLFSMPSELNEGGIFLDIGHDEKGAVSISGDKKNEEAYTLQSGMYASAMEHGVLEQVTGIESVSTMKAFEYASKNGIPLHIITKENLTDELLRISVSQGTIESIKNSVNSGRIVIIPEKTITINGWSGDGYMVMDPDTFACGYMISGGLAGGSMTVKAAIGEYVSCLITGAMSMLVWELAKTAALAVAPCGWVASINLIINAIELAMMISYAMQLVELFSMYQATGEIYYLQEIGVQLAAMATLGIASRLFGNRITALKEKIKGVIDEAGLAGKCFIAGTLIATSIGLVPIESVTPGMMVESFDPDTMEVSTTEVEAAFVKESDRLVEISADGEIITSTPDHPFYTEEDGFEKAIDLRHGDELYTIDGSSVRIDEVREERLEEPVRVYNFRVAENHTYFVGKSGIGTHNIACNSEINLPPQGTVSANVENAPKVDAGKQGKHVPGHNNYNPNKSSWIKGSNGVKETQLAWKNGITLPDGTRVWDSGIIVGPNGETGVRVHIDSSGNIHGYPVFISTYKKYF